MAKFIDHLARAFRKKKPDAVPSSGPYTNISVGTVIEERYRLDAEIGRGGMGIVYRAHDMQNERDVAIKIVDPSKANELTRKQFSRETEILLHLTHPHIVATYGSGTVNGGAGHAIPFLSMELLQGVPLSEIHTFTFARILEIGKQTAEALEYLHQQGFLYRDLKPGNIILEKKGFHYSVKLLDFGLACRRGEMYFPTESTRAGTVFYLAPELIAGKPADVATDLYALGATLYEMTTGRVPFADIDEQNILAQHLEQRVSPPSDSRSDVPPALESIILRLLEKGPRDRFASAAEVYDALKQVPAEPHARGNLAQGDCSGRESDTAAVIRLLESSQVVSVLDDDRELALLVGRQLQDQFAQGVWLVELDRVRDPAKVPETVGSVLGVPENPYRPRILLLAQHLHEKNVLLLLAHAGHLRAACAQLIQTLRQACPDVYFLATTDQPFQIPAERSYRR